MQVSNCLKIIEEIGTDQYLSPEEIPAFSDDREFLQRAWNVYVQSFDAYTGANIDPLFYRFDNAHLPSGRIALQEHSAILVVGTGPSLKSGIQEVIRLRNRILVFTSLRGAEALHEFGLRPDLIILRHSGPIETELSARNLYIAGPKTYTDPIPWIACEERTPGHLVGMLDNGRMFVPEQSTGWGLWPAMAVSLGLKANASKIGLLGIDLGIEGKADPAFLPLIEVLTLFASISPNRFWDCGLSGALKPGWIRTSLQEFASTRQSDSLEVSRESRPTTKDRLRRSSLLLESLNDFLNEAGKGMQQATQARQCPSTQNNESMHSWIMRMLSWKQNSELRLKIQNDLALSFLPRFWRTGISLSDDRRLWRPVLLCLSELVAQADRLKKEISDQRCVESAAFSAEDAALDNKIQLQNGPVVLVLPITYSCNARCQTCTIWRRESAVDFSLEMLRVLIEDPLVCNHLEVVNITGGEPFLSKDIFNFVQQLSAGFPKLREVGIPTNGSVPARIIDLTKSLCDALPSGVTMAITVSIDGGQVMHDSLRGISGLFEKSLRTVHMLVEEARRRTNLTVGINMTVTPANVSQIPLLEKIADEQGIGLTLTPAVNSDIFINAQAAQPFWSRKPSMWAEAADRIHAYARRRGTRHLEEASRILAGAKRQVPCVFWDRGGFIDTDGSLFVCPVSSKGRLGTMHEGSLGSLWGTGIHQASLDMLRSTECPNCVSNCMASETDSRDVIRCIKQSRNPILIFGVGAGGRKVYRHLERIGFKPQAFVDNAVVEAGTHPYGIPILPWDNGKHCRDAFTVIASSTGGRDIARQLESEGLRNGKDFVSYF
jgi:MoaA/NifB/PqqE/SkfB family radical SAM enzyme